MKKMPKFEGKSVKSQDSGFKLFGRTIPVKSQSDGCVEVERCEENSAENEEKLGKRPTKVVPCPRCESMDTKFCYFNNYNVNQPRHYCRKCQRYWTAGGSLRNVPVGAGRRKNKPCLGIHQRQFLQVSDNDWNDSQPSVFGNSSDKLVKVEPTYPELGNFGEALNGAAVAVAAQRQGKTKLLPQIDDYSNRSDLNLQSHKSVKEGLLLGGIGSLEECTHLAKGPEIGISAEKPKLSCSLSDKTQMSASKGESSEVAQPVEDVACDSSVNAMASKSEPQIMSPHGLPSLVGNPWSVNYNGCWGGMPSGTGGVQVKANGGVPWWAAGTGLLPAVNWAVPSAASMWGQQWCAPWRPASGVTEQKTLGKHERDEAPTKGESDGSLWVPKTMRLNDPGEALRSSFVENQETVNKPGSITSDGIFKAFQSKPGKVDSERNHPVQILCANPAALSRSASFVESS